MVVGVSSKWCKQWQSIRTPSFWQSVVLCCVVSSLVTFPQNVTPNSLDLHSILGQEAWSCGSDHCHTRCCWHSSFLICIPLLSCLKLVATFFQNARLRPADDALWNGKREIYFKGWWHGAGTQTLRHWTFIESSRCCILGDIHRTSVNRWEVRFAAACMASR